MTRYQTSQHPACFGGFPKRWCFVARKVFTHLVFLAALVQVIPVGLTSSRCVADSGPDALVSESLSTDTHTVDQWATQPTALIRVSDGKSSAVEPLTGGLTSFLSSSIDPNFLYHGKSSFERAAHRHRFVTLVKLNVRLQV